MSGLAAGGPAESRTGGGGKMHGMAFVPLMNGAQVNTGAVNGR
jgi:hypothetical protein